jgi:hypothetical protein
MHSKRGGCAARTHARAHTHARTHTHTPSKSRSLGGFSHSTPRICLCGEAACRPKASESTSSTALRTSRHTFPLCERRWKVSRCIVEAHAVTSTICSPSFGPLRCVMRAPAGWQWFETPGSRRRAPCAGVAASLPSRKSRAGRKDMAPLFCSSCKTLHRPPCMRTSSRSMYPPAAPSAPSLGIQQKPIAVAKTGVHSPPSRCSGAVSKSVSSDVHTDTCDVVAVTRTRCPGRRKQPTTEATTFDGLLLHFTNSAMLPSNKALRLSRSAVQPTRRGGGRRNQNVDGTPPYALCPCASMSACIRVTHKISTARANASGLDGARELCVVDVYSVSTFS